MWCRCQPASTDVAMMVTSDRPNALFVIITNNHVKNIIIIIIMTTTIMFLNCTLERYVGVEGY
jgi:hypothetical protein